MVNLSLCCSIQDVQLSTKNHKAHKRARRKHPGQKQSLKLISCMTQLLGQGLKITMINMVKAVHEEVDSMRDQMGNFNIGG